MRQIVKYKRIYLLGLIPISFALTILAKNNSYFAEHIFARHIYKWISQPLSTITSIIPFSLAEIIVVSLPVIILFLLARFIIKMVKLKERRKHTFLKGILNLLSAGSVVLFLFTILAGINYYRYPFSNYSGLEIRESSVDELYMLMEHLTIQANDLRAQVTHTDENGVFRLSMNPYELADMVDRAFGRLSDHYYVLGGSYGSPKPVFLSSAMSHTEITGIFFPFTMEANVNVDISDYSIPATMAHELAHLRGFMREDEANFIAYLACMESGSIDLKYSGTMLALIHTGNALYTQNVDRYFELRDRYSEGVIKDVRANSAYWQKYEDTVISTVSNRVNDTYLKANSQADGVESYGRMVDLLLAKYRKDHGQ